MKEMIKMVAVLTVLSALSGGMLSALRGATAERIENQQLEFVKGPAIREILAGCTNDPISDRFKIEDNQVEHSFFVGKFDGKPDTVVFESKGGGFGGELGVMVGVDITTDKIVGVGVTTHSETPGVGSKAKDNPDFVSRFQGLTLKNEFKVKADGGQVDALSGATVTSRGVCAAVTQASGVYQRLKPQIKEKIKSFN